MLDSFRGKLLIAKPNVMKDPHFAKSVVYIYEQTDKVCVGLVLNKPSYMNVGDIQTMRGVHNSGANGHLYRGGPVSEQSLMLLHTDDWYSTNTIQAWLVVEPNQEIFYNFDEEDQWQAGINLASSRLMDQLF